MLMVRSTLDCLPQKGTRTASSVPYKALNGTKTPVNKPYEKDGSAFLFGFTKKTLELAKSAGKSYFR